MNTNTENKIETNFDTMNEMQCELYLRENFGYQGYGKTSITKIEEFRTIENLRKECKCQSKIVRLEEINDSLLNALKKAESELQEWYDYNFDNIDSFNGEDKHCQEGRTESVKIVLTKVKEAIKKAEA